MGINLIAPGGASPTAYLFYDTVAYPGGSRDGTASMTMVDGVPVAAAVEIQSTEGSFLLPRLTTAQRDALTPVVEGMMICNTQLHTYEAYFTSGGWISIGGGSNVFENIKVGNGTEAEPSIAFTSNPDTGIYRSGDNELAFSAGGFGVARFTGTGLDLFGDGISGAAFFFDETATHYVGLTVPASGSLPSNIVLTLPATLPLYGDTPMSSETAGTLTFNTLGVIHRSVTITAANLKTMYTTGIEVLPPAGNDGWMIHRVVILSNGGNGDYTGGGPIYLQYGATGHGGTGVKASANLDQGVLTGASSTRISTALGSAITGSTQAAVSGDGVFISNDTAVFAGALDAATATLHIWCSKIPMVP